MKIKLQVKNMAAFMGTLVVIRPYNHANFAHSTSMNKKQN